MRSRILSTLPLGLLGLLIASLIVVLAIRTRAELASILLALMLSAVSIGAGVWANKYYSQKSFDSREREISETHAVPAFRMSKVIDEVLLMSMDLIGKRTNELLQDEPVEAKRVADLMETVGGYFLIVRRMVLHENANWHDLLPDEMKAEVQKREIETIRLAADRKLIFAEESREVRRQGR